MIASLLIFLAAYVSAYEYPHPRHAKRHVQWSSSTYDLLNVFKSGGLKSLMSLPAQRASQYSSASPFGGRDELHVGSCQPGDQPDAFKFFGLTEGNLTAEHPTASWSNWCFKKNSATFRWVSPLTAEIEITSSDPISATCTDGYFLTTIIDYDLKIIETPGQHVITYNFSSIEEAELAKKMGLKIVKFCDHWYNILPDLITTLRFFIVDYLTMSLDLHLPADYYEKLYDEHYRFLHRWEGLKLVPRNPKVLLGPDFFERNAKSGDIMCRYAGSGTSSMILWATGAQCSHIAVYMWGEKDTDDEGKLFVLQSNENGIWKTSIENFWNDNMNTTTVMLPLAKKYRDQFDEKKAWAWFKTVDGLPYGIHNMFFTFLDTPESNWPQTVSSDSWFTFLNILSTLDIPGQDENLADKIMGEALNHRLGTQNLTIREIVLEASKRGLTMGELISIPEQEGWVYNGTVQYVCCAFATALWYHGGLFGDLTILPNEFTNQDVFSVKVYDKDYELPPECKENDPELPFCITSGIYKVDPRTFNQIEPYSHMNERCPSKAPFYFRPDNC